MDSCLIQLTSGAVKNNRLNVRTCGLDFFPPGIIGGPKRENTGTKVTISAKSLKKPIITDIPSYPKNGKPRWFLRERSAVVHFYHSNKLGPGDKVEIRRLSEKKYELIPHLNRAEKPFKKETFLSTTITDHYIDRIKELDKDLESYFSSIIKVEPTLTRKIVSYQDNKSHPFYCWYKYKEISEIEISILNREMIARYDTFEDAISSLNNIEESISNS